MDRPDGWRGRIQWEAARLGSGKQYGQGQHACLQVGIQPPTAKCGKRAAVARAWGSHPPEQRLGEWDLLMGPSSMIYAVSCASKSFPRGTCGRDLVQVDLRAGSVGGICGSDLQERRLCRLRRIAHQEILCSAAGNDRSRGLHRCREWKKCVATHTEMWAADGDQCISIESCHSAVGLEELCSSVPDIEAAQ